MAPLLSARSTFAAQTRTLPVQVTRDRFVRGDACQGRRPDPCCVLHVVRNDFVSVHAGMHGTNRIYSDVAHAALAVRMPQNQFILG